MSIYIFFLAFLLLIINTHWVCFGILVEEELTLTKEEKMTLDRFRETVVRNLTQDYQKQDIFLVKWLRAKNFDLKEATQMLMKSLSWRKANNMDRILDENFEFSKHEYPFYIDGFDRTGRPVGTADVSVWDGRTAVVAGKIDEVYRYGLQTLELGCKRVRDAQDKGINATQLTLIVNLLGFNLVQNACLQCIPRYVLFVLDYENNYPGMVHKVFFINTPSIVDVLVRILLPLASPYTKEALAFYGTNRREWQEAILREIAPDQIRPQFGGTLRNDLDYL